jgi:hypothetical protein
MPQAMILLYNYYIFVISVLLQGSSAQSVNPKTYELSILGLCAAISILSLLILICVIVIIFLVLKLAELQGFSTKFGNINNLKRDKINNVDVERKTETSFQKINEDSKVFQRRKKNESSPNSSEERRATALAVLRPRTPNHPPETWPVDHQEEVYHATNVQPYTEHLVNDLEHLKHAWPAKQRNDVQPYAEHSLNVQSYEEDPRNVQSYGENSSMNAQSYVEYSADGDEHSQNVPSQDGTYVNVEEYQDRMQHYPAVSSNVNQDLERSYESSDSSFSNGSFSD